MPVNIALAGSGIFAQTAYLPALQGITDVVRLHSIWSRSSSSASKLLEAAKSSGLVKSDNDIKLSNGPEGLEKVLADPEVDAVAFVLPISAQPEYVIQALKAGKHVLSEKPVGKDLKTAKDLIRVYETEYKPKGLIWRVAENYNHDQSIRLAREIMATKGEQLGPVLYWQLSIQSYLEDGSKYHATEWRTIPDYQGGFLLDGGVHFAAMVRNILPSPPTHVVGYTSLHRAHVPPHDTIIAVARSSTSSDPHGQPTQLETIRTTDQMPVSAGNSTVQGTVLISFAAPDLAPEHRQPASLVVNCLNGVLAFTGSSAGWKVEIRPGKGTKAEAMEKEAEGNGVMVELKEWAEAIAAKKEGKQVNVRNDGEPRLALWDLGFIEALLNSSGKEQDLEALIA